MLSDDLKILDASKKTLSDWQLTASEHFNSLSISKKEKTLPLFILEHSFSPLNLQLISDLLLKDFNLRGINRSYWLLWAIYATDLGYNYTGEEYWQSFEEKIQKWDFHQREEVRWVFKEFQRKYSGIVPTGTWANHFTIISLPITHAILPKDLQYHFAKLLYLTRYKLKAVSLTNPISVGKVLSANAYTINSTRFSNFLQQEELVGRIALALLGDNINISGLEFLYPPTLKRIVSDLEAKRNAKEWVQETRRELKPKILGTASVNSFVQKPPIPKDTSDKKQLPLKPLLKLYHVDQNRWSVTVKIPKFLDLIDNSELGAYLKKTRVQIPCSKTNWLPADILIHNSLEKRLVTWPDSQPILKFESPHPVINNIINLDFTISKQPWLFYLGEDGSAIEIEGKILRPGKQYIALFENTQPVPIELSNEIIIDCANVVARQFFLPNNITQDEENMYKQWGFSVAKTIAVWPAGLCARAWDGEGITEWLTTESPCFGIAHDHEMSDIQITLDNKSILLKAKSPGEVSYIKIDPLQKGNYFLKIKTCSNPKKFIEGVISLNVREPISWTPGITLNNGLTAFLDPNDQNLDSFLRGKTILNIYGPQQRSIIIQIDNYLGNEILETFKSVSISLPFTNQKIKPLLSQILKHHSTDLADRARVRIICEDIGNRDFILTRDVKPFRWLHQNAKGVSFIRLVDETDIDEKTRISFFDLLKPDIEVDISSNNYMQKTQAKELNGLFWAHKIEYEHSIIISNSINSPKQFGALSIYPVLNNSTEFNLLQHLKLVRKWYETQCIGFLAQLHQEKIVEILVEKLYSKLCGYSWAKEEMNFLNNQDFGSALNSLSNKMENKSIANVTRFRLSHKNAGELVYKDELDWFIAAVERCDLCKQESLVKSVIAFASNALSFLGDNDQQSDLRLQKVTKDADLLRACRMFILGISRLTDPHRNYSLLISARFK